MRVIVELIRAHGGEAAYDDGTLTIDATSLAPAQLDFETASSVHGSVYLTPAMLARCGRAFLPVSGGCQIGEGPGGQRPFRHYLDVLERFGARWHEQAGRIALTARRLVGTELDLLAYTTDPHDREHPTGPHHSGASKTALLAAAFAEGTSRLHNLYPKPDVTDLIEVLRGFGLPIEQLDDGSVVVFGRGPAALSRAVEHHLRPDLIEIVTWACVGATLCEGPLRIHGPQISRSVAALAPELEVLDAFGVHHELERDSFIVHPSRPLTASALRSGSRSIFSDSQPFLALIASHAHGSTRIEDTVWPNRFAYARELCKLGIRFEVAEPHAHVHGPCPARIPDQTLHATDLRAAAVLALAALGVDGTTTVTNVESLERGYHDFVGTLQQLGAEIELIDRASTPPSPQDHAQ